MRICAFCGYWLGWMDRLLGACPHCHRFLPEGPQRKDGQQHG